MAIDFVAYHDRSAQDHQTQFNQLFPQGYRMTSLSVYGDRWSPLYAAVWVKRPGPDWSAVHGVDGAGYQAAFNNATANGFKPVLLAATGPASNPVFAGTFEKTSGGIPLTRVGLPAGASDQNDTFRFWMAQAHANSWIPTSIAIYGDASHRVYAGIWDANPRVVDWNADGIDDDFAHYQERFDAQAAQWARPACVAVSPDGRYCSVFRDDHIGTWIARHGMTSAGYQAEFDQWVQQGFYPLSVQAGGSGSNTRFTAIFAKQDAAVSKVWTMTGSPGISAIDNPVKAILQASNTRGGALAITKGARLVYARGYTYAEPGYPAIEPTTPMRQASVSKTFTAVAIHRLIAQRKLALTDTLQSILHLKQPNGNPPKDARFKDITVRHLLEHTPGVRPEALWEDPQIVALWQAMKPFGGFGYPATAQMVEGYIAALDLDYPPGQSIAGKDQYSNTGYWLLGRIVAKKLHKAHFIDALTSSVLARIGCTHTRQSPTLLGEQPADEARYHDGTLALGKSVFQNAELLVPMGYGAYNVGRIDATGGLSASAVDVARLLAALQVHHRNPLMAHSAIRRMLALSAAHQMASQYRAGHGFDQMAKSGTRYVGGKGGLLNASQNCIWFQEDDFCFTMQWNHVPASGGNWYPDFPAVMSAARAHAWPAHDRFVDYGFSSF